MKHIFDMKRFLLYVKKFYKEMRNLRFQFIALSSVLGIIVFLDNAFVSNTTFILPLMIYAVVSASSMSALFTNRVRKIRFLLTPASQFEKFLTMVLHLFVTVPLIYTTSLIIAQYCATIIWAFIYKTTLVLPLPLSTIDWSNDGMGAFASFYSLSVSFYLMGATYFTKHSFLKTSGIYFLLLILFAIAAASLLLNIIVSTGIDPYGKPIISSMVDINTISIICVILFTLLFLFLSYLRITEMEVNETKR